MHCALDFGAAMPGKIFINYRRDEVPGDARGVRDALTGKLGRDSVFMDIDNLLAGQRFDQELAKALDACDVLIAIIGPRWMELLAARTAAGERDYVREEIAAALQRGIVVIPARVGREGQMPQLPRREDLPEDIRDLVLYQKHDVAHERFGRDAADLIEAIKTVRKAAAVRGAPRRISPGIVAGLAIVVAATVAGVAVVSGAVPWPLFSGRSAVVVKPKSGTQDAVAQPTSADAIKDPGLSKADFERLIAAQDAKRQQAIGQKAEADARARAAADATRQAEEAERQKQAEIKTEADRKIAEADAKLKAEQDAARRDPALSITPGSGRSFHDKLADGKACQNCPEMVVAPAGSFTMGTPASEPEREPYLTGSESPPLNVTIARPFAVGKFSITRGEFAAFVKDTGHKMDGGCYAYDGTEWKQQSGKSWQSPGFTQDDRHPAVCVNWEDAKAYSAWLSKRTGKSYRFLSDAEREYVARAGTTTPFWWGTAITPQQANYNGNYVYAGGGSKGVYRKQTVPVDNFEANQWGLYQVHGNVWEWTADCWNESNVSNPGDGSARTAGDCSRRVVRGGSWIDNPRNLRSGNRDRGATDDRSDDFGFRVGRTVAP